MYFENMLTATSDTTDIILIKISSEGPTVSLRGSPTVSPLLPHCVQENLFLPFNCTAFNVLLALSYAPPALPVKIASITAEAVEPIRIPPYKSGSKEEPQTTGTTMASIEGIFISLSAPWELISIQVL